MTVYEAINEYHLRLCEVCKPPVPNIAVFLHSENNKAVGVYGKTRCK